MTNDEERRIREAPTTPDLLTTLRHADFLLLLAEIDRLRAQVEHWKSVSNDCSDNYHAMRSEIEAAAETSRKLKTAQERLRRLSDFLSEAVSCIRSIGVTRLNEMTLTEWESALKEERDDDTR